ncbi:MAG: tRNA1(Val) (adenine(37)-N6)-methyltransferase [Mucilaginibacter sp.]
MSGIFKFKQFDVDQTGCALKINTDGVLLGALTKADEPQSILDIGTGTGVIALMLAQRFSNPKIDAVEIDEPAANTARKNFDNSPFAERLHVYYTGFEEFFHQYPDKKYDLIVSNPPFYINSLKSPQKGKQLAKHADERFFSDLVKILPSHLTANGECSLILPPDTSLLVKVLALKHGLYIKNIINIYSYPDSEAHREILTITAVKSDAKSAKFVIYNAPNVYSAKYRELLRDFFTIF